MNLGIILYGPPASGKDTITSALKLLDPSCHVFPRLKVGGGKTNTYRITTAEHIKKLRTHSLIAWENERYGATYAVDTPELARQLRSGIPVLHLGQVAAIDAIRSSVPDARWLTVELWCSRETAVERLTHRNPQDVADRLKVWDETARLPSADLTINTDRFTPTQAAELINLKIRPSGNSSAQIGAAPTISPRIMVPMLTLRNARGDIDTEANAEYARRSAATWLDGFIVNGTIGCGEEMTPTERSALLEIWLANVSEDRVFGCGWDAADAERIQAAGARPMIVMRALASEGEAMRFLRRLPQGAFVYSHPNYSPTTFTASLATAARAGGLSLSGGKVCKISLGEVVELRAATGSEFQLFDGRCRHVARSASAGATGVIAAPLCTLPLLPPRSALQAVQDVLDAGQKQLDFDAGPQERAARLTRDAFAQMNA